MLKPDDVTFAVLVRGYGEVVPPQWTAISGLLGMMDTRFQLKPSTGEAAGSKSQGINSEFSGQSPSAAEALVFICLMHPPMRLQGYILGFVLSSR